jgi:error-prone DNA polymerase
MALPLETPGAPALEPLGEWGEAIADYRSIGMTLGEHPMGMLRDGLDRQLLRSADLERVDGGATVEVGGMVVARQRPETAKGIVFMLLEDECGTVNLIVPPPVYDRHRAEVRASPLVCATGTLERREGTTNVVVSEVRELERTEPPAAARTSPQGPEPSLTAAAFAKARRIAHECEVRRRAVAQLRAVTPASHSFGRRGR